MGAQESFDRGTRLRDLKKLFTLTRMHAEVPKPEELQVVALRLGRLDSPALIQLLIEARRAGMI